MIILLDHLGGGDHGDTLLDAVADDAASAGAARVERALDAEVAAGDHRRSGFGHDPSSATTAGIVSILGHQ